MDDTKNAFASKAVWGGIIAILAGIAPLLGFEITGDDTSQLADNISGIIAAVGGLIAIVGRIMATKKIGE